jgi:tetratricopeptide (TPR) repeat protein
VRVAGTKPLFGRMPRSKSFAYDFVNSRIAGTPMNDDPVPTSRSILVHRGQSVPLRQNSLVTRGLQDIAQLDETRTEDLPKDADGYYYRGMDYGASGNFDKAIADFTEAIRLKRDFAKAYKHRGLAFEAKRDYDNAIGDYTEAIRLEPNDHETDRMRSAASLLKTLATSANAAQLGRPPAEDCVTRGDTFFALGDYGKAIADYAEAIRLDPRYAEAYCSRGIAYARNSELGKAIADFTEAIRLDPELVRAHYNRGWAYGKKADLDRAIADYTEAIRLLVDCEV